MSDGRKFDHGDLQEMWDNVHQWQEVFSDHCKEAKRLELANKQLELEVKCLSDELSRYKALVETHEKSRDNWIQMMVHANEIEGQFSHLTKEKRDLEQALEDEKKMRAISEAKCEERRRNIENELRREIQMTKDSADKMIAEKEKEFRVQLEKYKTEIRDCRRSLEDKISQYEEKLLKMNSELANAQVDIWTLKQKGSSRFDPPNAAVGSSESVVQKTAVADKLNASSSSSLSSKNRAAQYFSQMSSQRDLFACRFPSTSVKNMTDDPTVSTTDDDEALTENEAVRPGGHGFKKKQSIRSFPAVKKKKLLPKSGDYF